MIPNGNGGQMIAFDIDGTLLDYKYSTPGEVNQEIIKSIKPGPIALVSNQGGLAMGIEGKLREDGRPYPTPNIFAERFATLVRELSKAGIEIARVRVCVYHPRASRESIQRAALEVRGILRASCKDVIVYTSERARKPSPWMLRSVGAWMYYGDSEEDEEAAKAARVHFVRVRRFMGHSQGIP